MSEQEKLPDYYQAWQGKRKGKEDEDVTIGFWYEACKGCGICVSMCPQKVWKMDKTLDKWNGTVVTVDNPNQCTKCMICEMHCPDFAIKII